MELKKLKTKLVTIGTTVHEILLLRVDLTPTSLPQGFESDRNSCLSVFKIEGFENFSISDLSSCYTMGHKNGVHACCGFTLTDHDHEEIS